MKTAPPGARPVPRRELVTLLVYVETGSHKAAAHRLGISESTSRQRVSQLFTRVGVVNAAQAVWLLRRELETEHDERDDIDVRTRPERMFAAALGTPNANP